MPTSKNHHCALMVPGDNQKLLDKIGTLNADIYILNLEDAISQENKIKARDMVCQQLKKTKIKQIISVRVNSFDNGGEEDIKVLNAFKPDAIRIPKVQSIDDVKKALTLIDKDIEVHLTIESAKALDNLKYFNIDKRVTTVFLGILDMFESLKIPQSLIKRDNPLVGYILSKFVFDSKLANLEHFSFVYQEYKNLDEFTKWVEFEKSIGISAKTCITPSQVEIANSIFSTSKQEIQKATIIKQLFENNSQNGINGFIHDKYGFIDEPIYKDALVVLKSLK